MRTGKKLLAAAFATALFYQPHAAHAVPAFARQTGMECSACHVGSFGPQLTAFGRDFKLNGYVMGGIKNRLEEFSAMVFGGYEHTKGANGGVNNHWTIDQASLFYAGALADHLGIFAQATHSGPDDSTSWDNMDIRYANTATLGGTSVVYGVTANNNPSVQDLWQTAPAWQFPFVSSSIAPSPAASPFMTGLGQTVGGAGVYAMWNGLLYTEVSGYGSLGDKLQQGLGETGVPAADHLKGINPYWRVALQHDFGGNYVSIGTFGMSSERYPGNDRTTGLTDKMVDSAVDATWQYTAGDHNFGLYGSAIHENMSLDATHALAGSTNTSDTLNAYRAMASYYYKNAYGLSASYFDTTGSTDAILYAANAINKPDSNGWTVQLDGTPFGTEKSYGYPYLNARVFVQYTGYNKFDGTSAGASDNNTLFTGVWFAF